MASFEGARGSLLRLSAALTLLACGGEPGAGAGGAGYSGMPTSSGVSGGGASSAGSSGFGGMLVGSAGAGGFVISGTGGMGGMGGMGGSAAGAAGAAGGFPVGFRVLVFIGEQLPHSHDSRINDNYSHCQGDTGDVKGTSNCGSRFIEELGKLEGFTTDVSFDPLVFTAENLERYGVVVWVGNLGAVGIPDSGRAAFEQYLRMGGGSLAMHYAISMEAGWAFYREALLGGGTFVNHSGLDPAKVSVEDANHPATCLLDASFMATSDYFQMSSDPRDEVRVLASIDDATIQRNGHLDGSAPGSTKHPVIWSKTVGQGRSFYSTFGHHAGEYDSKQRSWMRPLIAGALRWVAGLEDEGSCLSRERPTMGDSL